jgi:hypothetical protein
MPSSTRRRMLIVALLLATTGTLTLLLVIGGALGALRSTLAQITSPASPASPATAASSTAAPLPPRAGRAISNARPAPAALRAPGENGAPPSRAALEEAVPGETTDDQTVRAAIAADPDLAALIEDPDPAVRGAMHNFLGQGAPKR